MNFINLPVYSLDNFINDALIIIGSYTHAYYYKLDTIIFGKCMPSNITVLIMIMVSLIDR